VVARFRGTLRPGEAAVAYHLLRNELITWVVTREEVFVVRRRVQARRFLRDAKDLLSCASRGECAVDRMSDLLLRDWIERVPRETTLLIQPIAELQAVPFAMLKTRSGERLLARNATTYAPSFQAFLRAARNDAMRRGSDGAYFAAAARPGGDLEPLPRATNEVARASQWYRGAVVDAHASRARFLEQVSHFGVVHFAGHVLANEEQPLLSALVFERGDDRTSQMLYVHQLEGREFARARLVVLSACETGRAPRPTMSVANALLSQNVPSVVYTLWPVDDEASERFAIHFHRGIAAGASRVEAVRAAQLALLRIYSNRPDRWAAFAIAGAHVPLRK
jgi:CHAT domain-containing protein